MSTERRWYERRPPRDWHPKPAQLQRLQSSSSLHRSALERSSPFDRTSLHSSSSLDRSSSSLNSLDRSVLERSFRGGSTGQSTPTPAPLPRTVGLGGLPEKARTSGVGLTKLPEEGGIRTAIIPRSVSSPAGVPISDLNATYVVPQHQRPRDTGEARRGIASPVVLRPHSSSITKYAPLPAISSTNTTNNTSSNNNNNKNDNTNSQQQQEGAQFVPPPLVRSRTFDIIDTDLEELPVVTSNWGHEYQREHNNETEPTETGTKRGKDDNGQTYTGIERVQGGEGEGVGRVGGGNEEAPFLVTVSIEGKTLADYLSHARDGLLRSRPATRYGRPDPSLPPPLPPDLVAALPATLTPAQWNLTHRDTQEGSQDLEDFESVEVHKGSHTRKDEAAVEVQDKGSTRDEADLNSGCVLKSDDESNSEERSRNKSDYTVDGDSEPSKELENNGNSNNSDDDDDNSDKDDDDDDDDSDDDNDAANTKDSDENSQDDDNVERDGATDHLFDDEKNGYISDDEDDESTSFQPRHHKRSSLTVEENEALPSIKENQAFRGATETEDINVYFKLPDDSLLMASSPPRETLGNLLAVVERTRVAGKRMALLPQNLDEGELNRTLVELGIINNTVIYLLRER